MNRAVDAQALSADEGGAANQYLRFVHGTLDAVVLMFGSPPSVWTWLGPVLTFCGSALLFFGAMITLAVTNRSADRREVSKWRRDTIMRLSSDTLSISLAIQHEYLAAMDPEVPNYDQTMRGATLKTWQFFVIADNLRIAGAPELANACDKIRAVAGELNAPAKQCREALIGFADEARRIPQDEPERTEVLTDLFARRGASEWTSWKVAVTDFFMARSDFTKLATVNLTGTRRRRWYLLWLR